MTVQPLQVTQLSQEQAEAIKKARSSNGGGMSPDLTPAPRGVHNAYIDKIYLNTRADSKFWPQWNKYDHVYKVVFKFVDPNFEPVYKEFQPELYPPNFGVRGSELYEFVSSLFTIPDGWVFTHEDPAFKGREVRVRVEQKIAKKSGRLYSVVREILPGHMAEQPASFVPQQQPQQPQAPQVAPQQPWETQPQQPQQATWTPPQQPQVPQQQPQQVPAPVQQQQHVDPNAGQVQQPVQPQLQPQPQQQAPGLTLGQPSPAELVNQPNVSLDQVLQSASSVQPVVNDGFEYPEDPY